MEANGIVLSPDPRLRQECAVIEEITPAIEALAEKMKKLMFDNGGCGLAAPQIGELIQLVTIDCDYSDKMIMTRTCSSTLSLLSRATIWCRLARAAFPSLALAARSSVPITLSSRRMTWMPT